MENHDDKSQKIEIKNFADGLKNEFENFGEESEKNSEKMENNRLDSDNIGWTIRDVLDCFGASDFQALLSLSDKKIFQMALKNYPEKVRLAVNNGPVVIDGMAKLRARSIDKILKKYNYNIDVVIPDEWVAVISSLGVAVSIVYQAKSSADKIQDDLNILENKEGA